MNFLKPFILKFDAAVYSAAPFVQRMAMRQILIAPSIDPLSDKNRELSLEEIAVVLGKLGVPQDEPIVTHFELNDQLFARATRRVQSE